MFKKRRSVYVYIKEFKTYCPSLGVVFFSKLSSQAWLILDSKHFITSVVLDLIIVTTFSVNRS